MSHSTTFPRGSNAANRFTPEQKLERVGRAFKIYRACLRRADYHESFLDYHSPGTTPYRYRHAAQQQWTKYAHAVDRYIERLTAPAGGAE